MNDTIYIKQQASQFRQRNGLSCTEPVKLRSLLLKLGVLTSFESLDSEISGMSIKKGENRFMFINSEHTVGKQRFTICHELYHLYIQDNFIYMTCKTGLFDKSHHLEYLADLFAAYFLLPDDGVLSLIPKNEIRPKEKLRKNLITLSTIVKIEQYYSCSRAALIFKLSDMGLIDYDNYKVLKNNVKSSALNLGYGIRQYVKGNKGLIIGDYGEKAKKLFDIGKISETHYISLLNDIGVDIEENKMINDEENN